MEVVGEVASGGQVPVTQGQRGEELVGLLEVRLDASAGDRKRAGGQADALLGMALVDEADREVGLGLCMVGG